MIGHSDEPGAVRCLEEVESVRYSIKDLEHARKLGWLTSAGMALVQQLKQELARVKKRIAPFERSVLRSKYGRELTRHRKELAEARQTDRLVHDGWT